MRTTLLAVALSFAPLAAQAISVEFTPNPALPGTPVTITGTNASSANIVLSTSCGWLTVHSGSQAGPAVGPNLICISIPVTKTPGASFNVQWNLRDLNNVPVPSGNYWIETRNWDATFTTMQTNWFCLTVLQPGVPILAATGLAQRGQATPMNVNAATQPGGFWVCALSLDSNNPLSVLGLSSCLSAPITGAVFTPAFGVLDAQGQSGPFAMNLPNLAFIQYWGLQVQALTSGPAGLLLTNGLSFTVR